MALHGGLAWQEYGWWQAAVDMALLVSSWARLMCTFLLALTWTLFGTESGSSVDGGRSSDAEFVEISYQVLVVGILLLGLSTICLVPAVVGIL
jgi:hypothetical protein